MTETSLNFTTLLTDAEWEYYYTLKNKFDTQCYATIEFRTLLYNQVKCGGISFNLFLKITNEMRW